MDSSLCPSWVDRIYLLDSLAKAYHAMLLMYHRENNPVSNPPANPRPTHKANPRPTSAPTTHLLVVRALST